jgi:hypothetical protein
LLRAVAVGEIEVLKQLRRICAPDALLEVVLGLDPVRDLTEFQRLGLKRMSIESIDTELKPLYSEAGFEIMERGILPASEWPEFKTSWARKLRGSPNRQITYLIARAKG